MHVNKSKSRTVKGHVMCIGEMSYTTFWSENLKGRGHLENLAIDGTIIYE
jgi:hypothetical protein